jgi:pimeloyl-ACP methyl ester carboxylesterase
MRLRYLLLLSLLLLGCHASRPTANQPAKRPVITDGMVDIGDLSLHVHCAGQGAPTVVMDAGLGSDGSVWKDVQGRVGRIARTCVYDRAGLGYSSDPVRKPHTNRQMARELHQLLVRAGLDGPYVLVGHSMGGINVRLFESEHREQVAGMVLVDATVDPVRSRALVPEEELKKFREMLQNLAEGLDFDTFAAAAAEMRASSRSLGAKPLIILSRSSEDPQPWASQEQLAEMLRIWHEQQADLTSLSSNAIQIIVPNSRHFIQLDAPQVVAAAIEEVVSAVRQDRPLNGAALRDATASRQRRLH